MWNLICLCIQEAQKMKVNKKMKVNNRDKKQEKEKCVLAEFHNSELILNTFRVLKSQETTRKI